MARLAATQALLEKPAAEVAGAVMDNRGPCRMCSSLCRAGQICSDVRNHLKWCRHTTNLLGWKKPSKMVPPPHLAPAQNVLNVANLAEEVSPTDTNCLSPLLYSYLGHVFVYVSAPTTVCRCLIPIFVYTGDPSIHNAC
jgi:hypothetical protein